MKISIEIHTNFFWEVALNDFILKSVTEERFLILGNMSDNFYTLVFIKVFNFMFS